MANFYASYPLQGGGGGVPTYANLAAFPSASGAGNGALAIALDTDILYISNGTIWEELADPTVTQNAITALTGDVAATGPGSVAATIQPLAVTNAKIANTTIDLTAKVTGILPVANGGTNSATALNSNRVIISSGGKIVEQSALTASRALASDVSGLPVVSTTTSTELDFVHGVTSAIQTQLDSKVPTTTSISTSAPLTGGGDLSTSRTLAINQSGTSADGYLSSTDWNTFNGKQAAGNYITALTGDVAASGPGSVSATIQSGAVTNAKIAAAAGISVNKLAALTISSPVRSDGSGFLTTGNLDAASELTNKVPIANGGTNGNTANTGFNNLSPLTTKGDIIGFSTVNARLAVGTDGFGLVADSGQTLGIKWAAVLTNPMTTLGDIIYENATPAPTRLAGNITSTKNFLTQTGTGSISAAPAWGTIAAGDLPTATNTTQGAIIGVKHYLFGTAYTNGTPTLAGVSGFGTITTTANSWVEPYQTTDGTWLIRFNFEFSGTSTASGTLSVSGVLFVGGSGGIEQNVSVFGRGGPVVAGGFASANTNNIYMQTAVGVETIWTASGVLAIQSKPTWAD